MDVVPAKSTTMSTQKNLSYMIIGAAAGATLALLLAPSSGKKTRKLLMKQCTSVRDTLGYGLLEVEDRVEQFREKMGKKAAEVADDVA